MEPSAARTTSDPTDQRVLTAAGNGDEGAFAELVEPYRSELHAHCYRMLGSVHDAEDALQDALLRAWKALSRFEGRSSLRSWLYKIATNTCLDVIARRPKRVVPIDYGPASNPLEGPGEPLVESAWVEPYPDERLGVEDGLAAPEARYEKRESIELAFIAALQHLPHRRRPDPVRSPRLLRARGGGDARNDDRLGRQRPSAGAEDRRGAIARPKPAGDPSGARRRRPPQGGRRLRRGVGSRRVQAVVAMLTEDAAFSIRRWRPRSRGRESIEAFLAGYPLSGLALAPDSSAGERPARACLLQLGPRRVRISRSRSTSSRSAAIGSAT